MNIPNPPLGYTSWTAALVDLKDKLNDSYNGTIYKQVEENYYTINGEPRSHTHTYYVSFNSLYKYSLLENLQLIIDNYGNQACN